MLELVREVLVWAFLLGGTAFCLIGAMGMVRLPDVYTRIHSVSLIETLGAGLIIAGLCIHSGFNLISVKLVIILLFMALTNPTATHALVRALRHKNIKPWQKDTSSS